MNSLPSMFDLDSNHPLPLPSASISELNILTTRVDALGVSRQALQVSIGQYIVNIDGVKFESLLQTTYLVTSNLPSESYHIFMYVNNLLDAHGSSYLPDKDLIDENYHAQKGKLENENEARIAASFGKELPAVFVKVDSYVAVGASSSPLPDIKMYSQFNAPQFNSEGKQRVLDQIQNIFAFITGEISSRLAGLPQAMMLANTFLLSARTVIDSLLT